MRFEIQQIPYSCTKLVKSVPIDLMIDDIHMYLCE